MSESDRLRKEVLSKIDCILGAKKDELREKRQGIRDRLRFMALPSWEQEEWKAQGLDPNEEPSENEILRESFYEVLLMQVERHSEDAAEVLLKVGGFNGH